MRMIAGAALAAVFWALLTPPREPATRRVWIARALLGLLAWLLLSWMRSVRPFADALPAELPPAEALSLFVGGVALGSAAFRASGRKASHGSVLGLVMGGIGWCASRWPQLSRAIELGGGVFAGPFLSAALPFAFALTAAGMTAALVLDDLRAHAPALMLGAVVAWAAPTGLVEFALTRWWGFGPRSLAEAADVPTNDEALRLQIVRLAPARGRSVLRESVRMAAEDVDLSPSSLTKLEDFLESSGYRGVFAAEALKDVRQGWRHWWEADRALDAAMIAAPGRAHPDYRRALELIRAGPLDAERYAKLEQLAAAAKASPAGFEDVAESQYIFEGFSGAYARFGDEANARKWLYRIDNLWPINEKKVEVTQVEDFHEGRVAGSILLDGRSAAGVRVGLFLISVSSATGATSRLLSGATFPDDDGSFSFASLGPGRYELALLGRPQDLRGRISGAPGVLDIRYEHPRAVLTPIRIERDTLPAPEAFSPGGLPEAPIPEVPERALRWP